MVRTAKEHIRDGDIFQVVPSQRFSLRTAADPFDVYRVLRVVNPSPYMYFLRLPEVTLSGSSPEVLVTVQDGTATMRPIAGTRPRGADPAADAALEAELRADEKDGRVANPPSPQRRLPTSRRCGLYGIPPHSAEPSPRNHAKPSPNSAVGNSRAAHLWFRET
jgi:hypothetical protein